MTAPADGPAGSASVLGALAGRRVLVTGHTGFKGSWLATWLARLGADVWGFALPPDTEPALFRVASVEQALTRHLEGDVRDLSALEVAFAGHRPEVVFHLAAQALVRRSYGDPKTTFDTNVGGTVNVLECVRRSPSVRALVTVTSDKVYENAGGERGCREGDRLGGRDPYSASKAGCELVFDSYRRSFYGERGDLGAASARAGNVIGGGDWAEDRIVPDAIRALGAGQPIPVRNPGAIRPWQHVLDPLGGYLLLAVRLLEEPERFSGAWNFGPDDDAATSVGALVGEMLSAWGGGTWDDLSASGGTAPAETPTLRLSSEKARAELGWRPCWGLHRAVRETVAFYRDLAAGADGAELCAAQLDAHARAG